jgi:putative PEP-CTERM system TPR-repeat lipoprotein
VTALVAVLAVSAGCDWLMSDQDRFDKAQELIEQGRFGEASIQLKKLLQSTDEMPRARALLGRALLETGRAEEAESQLRKAREAGVSPDEYAVALATAYLLQAKHDRILEEFKAPALSGNDAIAGMHVVRGKAFLAKERFDRAAEAFNAALEAAPGDPGARVGLALLDSAQQRPEEAEARIDRLLEDTPDFPDALLIKGQLALSAGRHQQAAQAFERVGTQERHRAAPLTELQAMAGRVEALYRQGNLEDAGETVKALSERFPGHPLAAYMQGLIDYAHENHEAVISGLTPLVRGGEAMPGAYFLTGASHYALGNLEQAQVFLSRAAERAPGNTDARRLLAMTEMRLGQPDRAGEVVQSMGADAGDMWRMLGGLSLRQGDVDTGLGYLERGADSGDPAAAMDLAAAYIAGGRSGSGRVGCSASVRTTFAAW